MQADSCGVQEGKDVEGESRRRLVCVEVIEAFAKTRGNTNPSRNFGIGAIAKREGRLRKLSSFSSRSGQAHDSVVTQHILLIGTTQADGNLEASKASQS